MIHHTTVLIGAIAHTATGKLFSQSHSLDLQKATHTMSSFQTVLSLPGTCPILLRSLNFIAGMRSLEVNEVPVPGVVETSAHSVSIRHRLMSPLLSSQVVILLDALSQEGPVGAVLWESVKTVGEV